MGRIVGLLVLVVLLCGCDMLKGPKGEKGDSGSNGQAGAKGDSGLLSSKKYTGWTAGNPFSITVTETLDLSKQVIEIYRCNDTSFSTKIKQRLPWTVSGVESHVYSIENSNKISLFTMWASGSPTSALSQFDGTQFYYEIYIRTFSTVAAAQSYKSQLKPAKSQYDELIYGAN